MGVKIDKEEANRLRDFRLSLKERCPKCTYVPFAGETQHVSYIPQPIVGRVRGTPVIGEEPTQKLQIECKRCGYSWKVNSYDYVEDETEILDCGCMVTKGMSCLEH